MKRASPSRGALAEIPDPAALAVSYETGRRERDQRAHRGAPVPRLARRPRGRARRRRRSRCCARTSSPTRTRCSRRAPPGADLVLLIVAALDQPTLAELHELITSARHDGARRDALGRRGRAARSTSAPASSASTPATSRTFELDRDLFGRLADRIPSGVIRVAESAVKSAADVAHYRAAGADVVLVGEALVTRRPRRHARTNSWQVMTDVTPRRRPGPYFGDFGGRFVPESLIAALDELVGGLRGGEGRPRVPRRAATSCTAATPAVRRSSPRCRGSPSTPAAPASSSSAKTSTTPARTRSTTCSARRCSPSASARPA